MNKFDRGLRIIGSLLLMYIGFFNTGILDNTAINTLLGGFGVLNFFSAIMGFCPVYYLARLSTYKSSATDQK